MIRNIAIATAVLWASNATADDRLNLCLDLIAGADVTDQVAALGVTIDSETYTAQTFYIQGRSAGPEWLRVETFDATPNVFCDLFLADLDQGEAALRAAHAEMSARGIGINWISSQPLGPDKIEFGAVCIAGRDVELIWLGPQSDQMQRLSNQTVGVQLWHRGDTC